MEKIHIKKISEIDKEKLVKFYQESFRFEKSVINNYDWRYRTNFNEFEPLALLINDEICGHAGLIPIKININEKQENAVWFTDFYVSPKHRSKGYGKLLTKKWMEVCPIQLTFCNDKSLKIFKKFKWLNNNKIIRRIEFNNYLKIIPVFRKINKQQIIISEIEDLKIIELNNSNLNKIIDLNNKESSFKLMSIVRDESWFKWRLIECPYKKNINIFKFKEHFIITHIKIKNNFKILNIIYSSSPVNKKIRNIFLKYSKKNNIDYIAYLTNEKKFSDSFMPWQKKLNFAFYSDNSTILNTIKEKFDDVQLIDSDIDYL